MASFLRNGNAKNSIMPVMGTYQPTTATVQTLNHVHFAGIVGMSGSGKTTVLRAATDRNASSSIVKSHTSRMPRMTESAFSDHIFTTRADMEQRIANRTYIQYVDTHSGDLYATAPEDYATTGTAMMAIWATAVPSFRNLPFASCKIIYIVPPDIETWKQRINVHGLTRDQNNKRVEEAQASLQFALQDTQSFIVVNEVLSEAVEQFLAILQLPNVTPPEPLTNEKRVVKRLLEALVTTQQQAVSGYQKTENLL